MARGRARHRVDVARGRARRGASEAQGAAWRAARRVRRGAGGGRGVAWAVAETGLGFCPTIVGTMSGWTSHRSALWLACAVGAAAPARAEPASTAVADPAGGLHVALDYQVDPALSDCPSAADLSRVIRERLGYDPFVIDALAPHRVKASIDRAATGAEAHVEWLDAEGHSEGERRLGAEGGDCAELGRGLAFAIAVQIQLRASIEAPPPPSKPAPEPPKKPPPARPRTKPRTTTVTAGAGVLGQSGLTPGLSPGLRIFGSLGNARASIELSTEAGLPSERRAPDQTGFTASALTGKIAPCAHVSIVGFCGLGMLGQLSVRGQGVDRVESPSSLVGGAGARLQVLWPSGSIVGGVLHAEALVLFTPRTVVVNLTDVWSTAPVVFSAGIDLAAIFR